MKMGNVVIVVRTDTVGSDSEFSTEIPREEWDNMDVGDQLKYHEYAISELVDTFERDEDE